MTALAGAPDALMALEFGGGSVREHLDQAIARGALTIDADGTVAAAKRNRAHAWVVVPGPPTTDQSCAFYKALFYNVYNRAQVPHGCSACYKVKVRPRTVAELVACWHAARAIACHSKWGIDLNNRFSQDVYAGYFYTNGLEAAQVLGAHVRKVFGANARIGPEISVAVKRGCSDFEAAVGPSDRYTFTPEMAELEAWLWTKFHREEKKSRRTLPPLLLWIETAFRVGDDSYLQFTDGKRLHPPSVTYPVEQHGTSTAPVP